MHNVYFTYGTDSGFPFRGGWTRVEAPTLQQAFAAFRAVHPDRTPGILNCACYYSEEQYKLSEMWKFGNLGAFEHEVIRLTVSVK